MILGILITIGICKLFCRMYRKSVAHNAGIFGDYMIAIIAAAIDSK